MAVNDLNFSMAVTALNLNNLKILALCGCCVAIFLHEHAIKRLAKIERRENNRIVSFSF